MLALRGDTHADFIQFLDGRAFAFASGEDSLLRLAAACLAGFERLLGLGQTSFQAADLLDACTERLFDMRGLASESRTAGFDVGKLALSVDALVLERRRIDMCGLHRLASEGGDAPECSPRPPAPACE